MKIIGYQTKGNVVRFYLGSYDLTPKYRKPKHADDGTVTATISGITTISSAVYVPCKHAGEELAPGIYPYADFVAGWKDVYAAWNKTIYTNPASCIEDLRAHNCPLIVVAESKFADSVTGFNRYKGGRDVQCYYLDDDMEPDEVGLPDDYPEKSLAD